MEKKKTTIVVKIGGSNLSSLEKRKRVARNISREVKKGEKIITVVSAMGKTTDHLLRLAHETNEKITSEELDDILSMGERTSARLFCSALKAENLKAMFIDVDSEKWPIITDEKYGNANVLLPKTKNSIVREIKPLLENNFVVVVPGFIGKTKKGEITTLGRGGSDTTAFVIADAINAEQVVLVSEHPLQSGDPKVIMSPREIKSITVEDLLGFTDSGTKFMHKKSLLYKPEHINVRVVSNLSENFLAEGTKINGSLKNLLIEKSNKDIAMITVSGRGLIHDLKLLTNLLELIRKQKIRPVGVNTDVNSLIFYVEKVDKKQINQIHNLAIGFENVIGVAVRKNLRLLRIKGTGLETTEGMIAMITNALRERGENIFGIFTITNSILVFLDKKNIDKVRRLIEKTLGIRENG